MSVATKHPCLKRWRGWIDRAEQRGSFNKIDSKRSEEWDTCAVGEGTIDVLGLNRQDVIFGPKDQKLVDLGVEFAGVIVPNSEEFAEARSLMDRIERRLQEIIEGNINVIEGGINVTP